MMPLGAPSISKYGSLVRPDAQIVALRAMRLRLPLYILRRRPLVQELVSRGAEMEAHIDDVSLLV